MYFQKLSKFYLLKSFYTDDNDKNFCFAGNCWKKDQKRHFWQKFFKHSKEFFRRAFAKLNWRYYFSKSVFFFKWWKLRKLLWPTTNWSTQFSNLFSKSILQVQHWAPRPAPDSLFKGEVDINAIDIIWTINCEKESWTEIFVLTLICGIFCRIIFAERINFRKGTSPRIWFCSWSLHRQILVKWFHVRFVFLPKNFNCENIRLVCQVWQHYENKTTP